MIPVPQIPYAAIGLGVALLAGIWAFLVAETDRAKAVILIAGGVSFGLRFIVPSRTGRLVSLVLVMIYGAGCLLFLRFHGAGVR